MASILTPAKSLVTVTAADDNSLQSPKFLGDLGKPTLRGVRKCDKCGTFNGTRGTRCKNKLCDQVFKVMEKKKGTGPESVKLLTDPGIQIYSVRMKASDTRGFVQLPIVQDLEGNPAVVDAGIVCSAARCYVESCSRARNDAVDPCFHIRSSVESAEEAIPFSIKNSVLNSLPVSADVRHQIWTLATDKPGPLVQRVTKHIFVVKTEITAKHPLGYIHFAFYPNRRDDKRFVCECKRARTAKILMTPTPDGCKYKITRCIHFYACVVAFSSDEELSKEFRFAIDADKPSLNAEETEAPLQDDTDTEEIVISSSELVPKTSGSDDAMEIIISSGEGDFISSPSLLSPSKAYAERPPEIKRFKPDSVLMQQLSSCHGHASLDFSHWLNSVTERINQTMHYSLSGNPDPLVFHIPQSFWECLQQRISSSSSKRRLPDCTDTITRTRTPPLGNFMKFTWYIRDLAHVRSIFDTTEVALLVSKYFDKHKDGTFHLSQTPRVQVETISDSYEPRSPSKYHEYKTYLRVGQQNNGFTPFTIEWTPDILPITKIGELRLIFNYGHVVDGLAPAGSDDVVKDVLKATTDSL